MDIPQYIMVKSVDFIGKPSKMGNKVIIIIPSEFHKEFEKLQGRFMKFHGEEILEK
jgi:hypothetical protein